VHVETPSAPYSVQLFVTVFPAPPTEMVGVIPAIAPLSASRKLIVIVLVAMPFALTGPVAVTKELSTEMRLAGPGSSPSPVLDVPPSPSVAPSPTGTF